MLALVQWDVTWSTHHLVLIRSTAEWGCQSLLLLAFFVSTLMSSAMMALLTNSVKVPEVLSDRCSLSLVDKTLMKQAFFLASVSTYFGVNWARWLNSLY
jgi:hypothetical protein